MPEPEPQNLIERFKSVSIRSKLLVVVGVALAIMFTTQNCSGVEIEEDEAVATAKAALAANPDAFESERAEAKILRQGFPPRPMWVVVFTVPDPEGGPEDFLRHAAVWVDASSGDVHLVDVSEPEGG